MIDLKTLNGSQRSAIDQIRGPVLVLAGAGSGKTRVLTYRIAYLIKNVNVPANRILALTFTNKAANEMKERLRKLGVEPTHLWVGTFHSICTRILRRHADRIGYSSDFTIYDSGDQTSLIKMIMKELNISDSNTKPAFVKSQISDAKNHFINPERYVQMYSDDFALSKVAKIYKEYERRLNASNSMDFDDLLIYVIRLFDHAPEILRAYQEQFAFIHVDEYQDTNMIQYTLVKKLAELHKNLCVVGDNDQSIYGWRGADIRNITEFEKDFDNSHVALLEQNYRSTKNILNLANSVIKNNPDRKDKVLWTENEEGELISYYIAQNEKDEANFIADEIVAKIENGASYSDFAILYRTNTQSQVFESAFNTKFIPYKIVGGLKYYDRKEIKDLMAYLKLVVNPKDESAFLRAINEPKRGLGDKSVEKILEIAQKHDADFVEAIKIAVKDKIFNAKLTEALKVFYYLVHIPDFEDRRPSDILNEIIKTTGYVKNLELEADAQAQAKIENIEELVSQIMNFENDFSKENDDKNPSLSKYLQDVSLISDQDQINESNSNVLMMTLHTAKGLEFENVFLVGLEEGLFPSAMSIEELDGVEEERRLCYVGITRAMKKLTITRAFMRNRFGKTEVNPESRFIDEMDQSLLELKQNLSMKMLGIDNMPSNYDNGLAYGGSSMIGGESAYGGNRYSTSFGDGNSSFGSKKPYKSSGGPIKFGMNADKFLQKANSKPENKENKTFEIGDRVEHKVLGDGTVVDVIKSAHGSDIKVLFDNSGKELLLEPAYAPIKLKQ